MRSSSRRLGPAARLIAGVALIGAAMGPAAALASGETDRDERAPARDDDAPAVRTLDGASGTDRPAARPPARAADDDDLPDPAPPEEPERAEVAPLVRQILDALRADPLVGQRAIEVSLEDGLVRLGGRVESSQEWKRAEDVMLAVAIDEIDGFINHLTVGFDLADLAPGAMPFRYAFDPYAEIHRGSEPSGLDDEQVRAAIERQLQLSPLVGRGSIGVTVRDGVATLIGLVGSWDERRAAARNALEGGARLVIDKLRVRFDPGPPKRED